MRITTANMGFAIAGVPFFADTFVHGGSSVLRMKFSAKYIGSTGCIIGIGKSC